MRSNQLHRRRSPKTGRALVAIAILSVMITPLRAAAGSGIDEQKIDQAIVRGLKYLERKQQPSGAWRTGDHGESTAATSLAVMAFMAAGHVPGEGPYRDHLERGIRWVISRQDGNGQLLQGRHGHGPMYSHGIATLMLAEVYGMVDSDLADDVKNALERAILLILKAQQVNKNNLNRGGWRYNFHSGDSDLSVTGWQLLALRAAKDVGCDVPAASIDAAISYVKRLSVPGHHGFGYDGPHGPTPARSGTGITALEVCGDHHSPESLGAARFILRRPLQPGDHYFYYGAYYCSVGLFKVGGHHWEQARPLLFRAILNRQNPNDGSWLSNQGHESATGKNYCTSMAVLALAVEYRYLPIYQR